MISIFGYEVCKDYIELILFGVGFIFTVLGWILGFFAKRWHIRYQINRQEFIKACQEFRSAFMTEYSMLDSITYMLSGQKSYIYIKLRDARIKHKTAVTEFMLFLSEKQRITLREAWIYYSGEDYDEKGKNRPFYYINEFEPDKIISEGAQEVMFRMDKILNIAKP